MIDRDKLNALAGSKLFDFSHECPKCGLGHLSTPCSKPCVCRCRDRQCNARMHCHGDPASLRALAFQGETK